MNKEINYKDVFHSIIYDRLIFPVERWSLVEEDHGDFKYIRLDDIVNDRTLYKVINSEQTFNEMYFELLTKIFISGQSNLK